MSKAKMKIGSSTRFTPKPTTMQIIDGTTAPSLRIVAERPKATWAKRCEKTTRRRYVFAISKAPAVTDAPPDKRRIGSMKMNTSGGRMKKKRSFNAISSPRIFSHAVRSPSPNLMDRTAACPAPTNTPNAPNIIITGKTSVRPAIASCPHPCPM